jgi:hypothetical protein
VEICADFNSDATTAERQLLAAKNAATGAYSSTLSAAATLALAAGVLELHRINSSERLKFPSVHRKVTTPEDKGD